MTTFHKKEWVNVSLLELMPTSFLSPLLYSCGNFSLICCREYCQRTVKCQDLLRRSATLLTWISSQSSYHINISLARFVLFHLLLLVLYPRWNHKSNDLFSAFTSRSTNNCQHLRNVTFWLKCRKIIGYCQRLNAQSFSEQKANKVYSESAILKLGRMQHSLLIFVWA